MAIQYLILGWFRYVCVSDWRMRVATDFRAVHT